MKGPPWIPEVGGDAICDTTEAVGLSTSCQTFNEHDVTHLKSLGYNMVRLGVTWAGAQPNGPNTDLDADVLRRLDAFLNLAQQHDLQVLIDLHQDAVGTAVCGEGVPMWLSKLATPNQIGKPLFPLPALDDGTCGRDDTEAWASFAGDADYNIKNECCRKLNQATWSKLSTTLQAQETMLYLFTEGRSLFADFVGRVAEAVADKDAVFGIELMNEPPAIERNLMYQTWEAAAKAVRAVSPDLAVGVADTANSALPIGNLDLRSTTVDWLRSDSHLFYAFHWYGKPDAPETAIENAQKLAGSWGMPVHLTEFGGYGGDDYGCATQRAAAKAGVGSSYWHYSDYCWPKHCPDGSPDGYCDLPDGERWGACITGWGSGNNSFACP
jgi:hypothetical protein